MAINIIRDPFARGTGGIAGEQLGQLLGGGLQQLAAQKLQQMQARHGLQALGIPQEEAKSLALLPENLQQTIVKNYLAGAERSGLDQALGQLSAPTPSPDLTPGKEEVLERPQSLAEVLRRPRLTQDQRLKIEALKQQRDLAQQKISSAEQREINKETLPVYKEIIKKAKGSRDTLKSLSRMEKLIDTGKLTNPVLASLLKTIGHGIFGVGLDLTSLQNPESQEFEKLSNNFIKTAKDIFGARITNQDLDLLLKTIPTLTQTDAGKKRVLNLLRAEAKGAILREKAMRDIIRENNGRRPADLEGMIEDRVGNELDQLAQKMIAGEEAPEKDDSPLIGKTLRGIASVLPI